MFNKVQIFYRLVAYANFDKTMNSKIYENKPFPKSMKLKMNKKKNELRVVRMK